MNPETLQCRILRTTRNLQASRFMTNPAFAGVSREYVLLRRNLDGIRLFAFRSWTSMLPWSASIHDKQSVRSPKRLKFRSHSICQAIEFGPFDRRIEGCKYVSWFSNNSTRVLPLVGGTIATLSDYDLRDSQAGRVHTLGCVPKPRC